MAIHGKNNSQRVVITGIGLICANGFGRESVWQATRNGITGIRQAKECRTPLPPPLQLAATVDVDLESPNQLKVIRLARLAAEEALFDAGIDFANVDADRFGCAVSGHVGDISWWDPSGESTSQFGDRHFNAGQWLPNSACWDLANRFGLNGPRHSHSTACASGLIDVLTAARSIQEGKCDVAITGTTDAILP